MTFGQYISAARLTATYPKKYADTYLLLGMRGESGEVCDKVKKLIRDKGWVPDSSVPKDSVEPILLELGDVLWYIANYCYEHELSMTNDDSREMFGNIKPVGVYNLLCRYALKLSDDVNKLRMSEAIDDIAILSTALGFDLNTTAQMNIEKLQSRLVRDTLNGSGDYR